MPRHNCTENLAPDYAKAALSEGRVVLLLDGLDEVPGSKLRAKVAQVVTELANTCDKLKLLVTCRPAAARDGARPGEPFENRHIAPFDDEERLECTTKWFQQRNDGHTPAETEAARLLAELGAHPKVAAQARNPLVLSMICLLFRTQGCLPRDRAQLYNELIEILLKDRNRDWLGPAKDVDRADKWAALIEIAWAWRLATQSNDTEGALLTEAACVDAAEKVVKDRTIAKDLIQFFELRTSLLDCHSSQRGRRQLKFGHRTLAEYLVAGRLAADGTDKPAQELKDNAHDGDWREIARLYVNIIVRERKRAHAPAFGFIKHLIDKATHDQDWPKRAAYGRLAAECYAECKKEAPDGLTQQILGLQPVFRSRDFAQKTPAVERMDFWEAVGTDAVDLGDDQRWVKMPAGEYWRGAVPGDKDAQDPEKPGAWVPQEPFWVQRWPVTVAEYQAFMSASASGHEPEYWQEQLHHPTRPVVAISWLDASAYARWMNQQHSDLPQDWSIHLPSEAQWEAAGRGRPRSESADLSIYPWHGPFDANSANCHNPWGHTKRSPVGAFPGGHTHRGVWDMSGNIWEWCLDGYSDDAHPRNHVTTFDGATADDPKAPRVARGHSFFFSRPDLRLSVRDGFGAGGRGPRIGFRVVCSVLPRTLGI